MPNVSPGNIITQRPKRDKKQAQPTKACAKLQVEQSEDNACQKNSNDEAKDVEFSYKEFVNKKQKEQQLVEAEIAAAVRKRSQTDFTSQDFINENAVIGAAGNPNKVSLKFSNNPNNGGEGDRGTTPEDKVIVFTYKLTVNKVDKDNKPLTGAEFSLFKKVKVDGQEELKLVEVKKILSTNTEGTVFGFTGLDDGTYVLRETKTPDGYNSIEDQTFTISAKHDESSDKFTMVQTGQEISELRANHPTSCNSRSRVGASRSRFST